ncbi:MAG: chemotaxis response regulator protein-glutamate methylesterase [Anaerolineales bacterium]|nr:chemotaxis response regulator protein-glutamate methylesterase [Anaerolineales bacterium]
MNLRVLVVDDTSLFRRVITDALALLPDVEVVGTAPNGKIALERIATLSPDLITLDIEMPEMDGLEVLNALKSRGIECGVVVVSALTLKGGDLTIRALERGAFDFITKPSGGDPQSNLIAISKHLAPIVSAYRRRWEIRSILKQTSTTGTPSNRSATVSSPQPTRTERPPILKKADLVLIGVSTGGPNALAKMLPALPLNFPVPILIVQHMPPLFTKSMAASLSEKCKMAVKEAEDREVIRPATVYIAPGGRHMKIVPGSKGEISLSITDDPLENNCRPSVDYLFRSVANTFNGNTTAVIMTGMGSDGVLGLRLLKRKNCHIIAQDEASCVVFGMPGEAVKAGVVDVITPLDHIAEEINRSVKSAIL